ncbi:MAG: UDP-N-acetylmuramoyl-L-alanyl-D-glutamate--2,6-diaminopimelate ligase [Bacteroidetes bacterium]|nr:UDP-N-acetylmuramoyl-L-alanyl-D-glutamate--2,6-diaminopimelate ligase [Bacteroidota bacterium]
MKILNEILYKCGILNVLGKTNVEVSNISFDSRMVEEKSLFIAVRGTAVDGHLYIQQAISKGAIAIACEKFPEVLEENITYIKVKDSSFALGVIASNYFDNPSSELKLVGVTGTNGKTTTVTLLFNLFKELGYNVGMLTTVCNKINDIEFPSTHTTPDAIQLNAFLKKMVDSKCSHCFMEVSSHSIVQNRIAGLDFIGGVFSNITHDHLDFHKTFDEYIKAKKLFFDGLKSEAFALVNADDKNGMVMLQNTKAAKSTYSLQKSADFKCKIIENQFSGMLLNIDGNEVWSRLVGNFNAYNLLSIYATSILLGEEKTDILKILSNLNAVEGRFDYVKSTNNVFAIVDYAHTPDALKNVIDTINSIKSGKEQLITVVGCGGDRDAKKRPIMAKIAFNGSAKVILTSDNPRSEDPAEIIEQMKSGLELEQIKKVLSIENRKEAIKTACSLANSGDVILVAGKGHEKYQEINGVKHPFDDKQVLIDLLT